MLTTSNTNNHDDRMTDRDYQQQSFYYQPASVTSSTSSCANVPSYNLFNSLPLFGLQKIAPEWEPAPQSNRDDLSFPTNQGLIADLGSSSTQSPKEDFWDDFYFKHRDTTDMISTDTVMFQLKDALETIQVLHQKMNLMTDDLQHKQQTIHALRAALSLKELELQKQSVVISTMNQVYTSDRFPLSANDTTADFEKHHPKLSDHKVEPISTSSSETKHTDPLNLWKSWNEAKDKKVDHKPRTEKTVTSSTDWHAWVSRILRTTDQQASIHLQQKLKTCSTEQKQDIFQAVHREAYGLMTNRFGNFLVQRIFEVGTPEQISLLALTMKGYVLTLTCEPFGCHVVQKALDFVDEETKASMVTELFERVPETIIHKSACHVWQKIFEIRWVNHPVPVMTHVYQALKGRWAQVALDETGSLVIQNIFENLPEDDKRPVLNEILENLFSVARGQWGNWVIQHILEQAENSKDREMAFDMVLRRGIELSMDQFASKVVEKALSIGGAAYMSKFIRHISTESRSYRPRIALIDIASDQYGNYVVQWIINNASETHKINVCKLIKRHMVSLRGSKYGQRVAFLVEKALKHHEINTYPSS